MSFPRLSAATYPLRPWLLLPLLLLLSLAAALPARAAIVNVPAEYNNIQAAVYNANNGDTVMVAPGNYAPFDFNGKLVTVTSDDPTNASVVARTVINGGGITCVTFSHSENSSAVLTGFTLVNANGSGVSAIALSNSSSPIISKCVIGLPGESNTIGITATSSTPTIQNCTIQNNTGIAISTTGACQIMQNTIQNNGGLGISTTAACTIAQNTLSNNAGGLALTGAAYVAGNLITNNNLATDGAGILADAAGITIQNNVIANNTSAAHGGGVSCVLSTNLFNNTFDNNSAATAGGNIYVAVNTVRLDSNIITDAPTGGGIAVASSVVPVEVAYNDLWNNGGGSFVGLPDQTGTRGNFSANPLFVNPGSDYHVKSVAGHWTTTGFVLDTVTSPCCATGDPGLSYNLQPTPNGSCIEVGTYGDTPQASKTTGPPAAPKITAGPTATPQPVIQAMTAQCSVTVTDKSTYTLSYLWTAVDGNGNPAGAFDNNTVANPHWTAPATVTAPGQSYRLTVTVLSSSGRTAQGSVGVFVIPPPPDNVFITAGPTATPATIQVSQQTACSVTATETDGLPLTYAWTAVDAGGNPAGSFDIPASATPHWTAPAGVIGNSQIFTLTVVVTNTKALTTHGAVNVTVNAKPDSVTITGGPAATPASISQGQQTSLSVTASDTLGNPLTYAWTATDSSGHAAGTFDNRTAQNPKWTAPTTTALGNLTYIMKVVVTCPTSGATATKSATVTVQVDQMVLNTPANGDANPVQVGQTVDCNVSITDSLGYAVTYAWTAQDGKGRNVGLFDNPISQTPVWTAPASLTVGQITYTLKVVAHSTQGTTVTSSFSQMVVENSTFVMSLPGSGQFTSTGVQPATAAPKSLFTFQINYLDTANRAPTSVQVYVWSPTGTKLPGSPFTMTAGVTTYRTGVLYQYPLVLSTDGIYSYQFKVMGPLGTVKYLPTTGSDFGPFVDTPPQPTLVGPTGGVLPASGPSGAQFTFQVKYRQAEGHAPTFVRLWLWGTLGNMAVQGSPFTMTPTNLAPNYITGVVFQRTLTLTGTGTCQYRFEVSDGGPSVTTPATGTLLGPVLTGTTTAAAVRGLSTQAVGEGVCLTYTLAAPAQVTVEVLNVAGRIIAQLNPDGVQASGLQSVRWSGRGLTGSLVPSGTYLVRVTAHGQDGAQAQGLTAVNLLR